MNPAKVHYIRVAISDVKFGENESCGYLFMRRHGI
jgi:hypothetical protein